MFQMKEFDNEMEENKDNLEKPFLGGSQQNKDIDIDFMDNDDEGGILLIIFQLIYPLFIDDLRLYKR